MAISSKIFQDYNKSQEKKARLVKSVGYTKPKTNLRQTQDKPKTNLRQTQDKPKTNLRQTQDKPKTKPKTNLRQTQDKPKTNLRQIHNVYELIGIQKNIMFFICNICIKSGNTTTPPLTINNIAEGTNCKASSIRKTIQRLENMKLISRYKHKAGRGGWTQYFIDKLTYSDLLNLRQTQDKLETNLRQTQDKLETQLETNPPSSSSNINTITREEFLKIDIPQILKEHKFNLHILKQIYDRKYLNKEDLEQSLNNFAFDIEQNNILIKKQIISPLNYFMGVIKNKTIYIAPDNFESDEDKAFRENQKRLKELKEKRIEKENLLKELAFEKWLNKLSDDEKLKIAPLISKQFSLGSEVHNTQLKSYFKERIYKDI
jgi:predicted transcriptional regulator